MFALKWRVHIPIIVSSVPGWKVNKLINGRINIESKHKIKQKVHTKFEYDTWRRGAPRNEARLPNGKLPSLGKQMGHVSTRYWAIGRSSSKKAICRQWRQTSTVTPFHGQQSAPNAICRKSINGKNALIGKVFPQQRGRSNESILIAWMHCCASLRDNTGR